MLVRSPKTEHHKGHESRLVPLFPELVPYLREAFEQASPGTEYVITRYRNPKCNLRSQFERIIIKSGLKPWPKLFQNLRSTRETELVEKWPEHVVCAWIGNSKAVAREHYLQVTDEHFEQAAKIFTGDSKAAQNAAQQMSAEPCNVPLPVSESAKYEAKTRYCGTVRPRKNLARTRTILAAVCQSWHNSSSFKAQYSETFRHMKIRFGTIYFRPCKPMRM